MASSTRMRTTRALVCLALWMAAAPLAAHAATATEQKAKLLFRDAERSYNIGDFERALHGYAEAYRLDARPGFLFNMAQSHRQLGNWERAAFYYERYLDTAPAASPNAKTARDLLKDVQAKRANGVKPIPDVPRADPTPVPAGDEFAQYPLAAKPLPSEPSQTLAPLPPVRVPVPQPPSTQTAAVRRGSVLTKWWFWTAVGVGVVGGVVTVVALDAGSHGSLPNIDARGSNP